MNKSKKKQTQSEIQLEIMKKVKKTEAPDLELESIIDDQTADNEANYLLAANPYYEDSKLKETLGKISEEDLF